MKYTAVLLATLLGCSSAEPPPPLPTPAPSVSAPDGTPQAPPPARAASPVDPNTFVIEVKSRDNRKMVKVPAGSFPRGSDSEAHPEESPEKQVTLDTFWIDRTPVTAGQFQQCVDAKRCRVAVYHLGRNKPGQLNRSPECNFGVKGREDHPMNCVSWVGARAYCRWARKQLPTEAQWEKAARGSAGSFYPWGHDPPTCKRACVRAVGEESCPENSGTCPVGTHEDGVSPFGAQDMSGNVWEWTADAWNPSFYRDEPGTTNPRLDHHSEVRAIRGGSATSGADALRAASRAGQRADARPFWVGFRCSLQ